MAEDTSPERQAYSSVRENGYKGRFAANIINIRLMKDNPYIKDLNESERAELNASLLSPYQGEQFYDDDRNVYVADITKDPISGEIKYTYTSQTKHVADLLKYYETRGVLNQLMSAYNNGQTYKFYFDIGRKTLFPNSSLVFPTNYSYYTISAQQLNTNNQKIYVAGVVQDGSLLDVRIGMHVVNDAVNGTRYTRMGTAKIFEDSNPDGGQYAELKSGEFYVVDFFDSDGELIDTKQFQAVKAMTDVSTQLPSASVVKLKITVFKNNITANTDSKIYGIYAGEDLSKTTSFAVIAVYDDGTEKLITDKLDTPVLTREGWDVNTTGAAVGDRFPVTFTYWSTVDEDGHPTGSKIEETIEFQVMENNYTKLYKVLPVIWTDNVTDLNVAIGSEVVVYKLKVFTMSSDGIITNASKAFYDSKKVVQSSGDEKTLVDFTACPVTYDPYQQCVIFTYTQNIQAQDTEFNFQVRSNGILQDLRFTAKFGSGAGTGLFVQPLTNYRQFGYETDGLFSSLAFTYAWNNNTVNKCNLATIKYEDAIASKTITLGLNAEGIYIRDQYARMINGILVKPSKVQLFMVKDATFTPISPLTQINTTASQVTINVYKDDVVNELLNNNRTGNFIFAKFVTEVDDASTLINIEVFKTVMQVIA